MAHLITNGHIRCGDPKGHISFAMRVRLWPEDTRITSNLDNVTCENCLARVELPPPEVSRQLEETVEEIKDTTRSLSAMEELARALDHGVTFKDLRPLSRRVVDEMQNPQGTPDA